MWNAVEMRWNNGVLEFRALIVRERELYNDGEPYGDEIYVDWNNRYTEWKPVPVHDPAIEESQ